MIASSPTESTTSHGSTDPTESRGHHHERAPQRHVGREADDRADAAGQREDRREVAHDRGDRQRQGNDLEVLGPAEQRARPGVQRRVQREPEREVHEEREQEAGRQRRRATAPRLAHAEDRRWRSVPESSSAATAGSEHEGHLREAGEPDAADLADRRAAARSPRRSAAP